jgi:peptide/nickel transport system substrate-binding protein
VTYFGPKNASVLVDESQGAVPDSLDPGYAFFSQDGSYLTAAFQDLAVYNGTNAFVQLPVEAQSWSITNNSQEYIFHMRPDVYFNNGDNVTAYTIWFSYVRELYMNAPSLVGTSNWNLITMNVATDWFTTTCGNNEPWGLVWSVSTVTHIPLTASNCKHLSNFLNGMLSHFNPNNATQAAVMAFQHQAYIAPNATTFIIRTLRPYAYVISDLAGFSGTHTVDPAFVDAHGGVQNNTANSYLNTNCEPSTGPYICKSVSAGLSEIVMVKNPHYWAAGNGPNGLKPGLPWVIRPGQIPVIDIKYALTGTTLYEDFGTNVAAIGSAQPGGSAGIPEWGQMWAAYQYKNWFKFNQIVRDFGPQDFSFYLGMNTQRFPTNITAFRQAVYWAMNYTALADTEIYYNGTAYGSIILGPATPQYGPLYNPNNQPLPHQDLKLAIHYLDLAGKEANFYVVLPNGTVIGNPNGKQLQPVEIVYIAPLSPTLEVQLKIYQDSLSAIGIPTVLFGETSAVYDTQATNPKTAPVFSNIGWGLDYPDPWLQQYVCFYTLNCGIASYINNATLANLVESAAFNPNPAQQLQADKELYNIEAQEAYYVWLPYPDQVFWLQPYLQGIVFNIYTSYYYNLMYYQPVPVPKG